MRARPVVYTERALCRLALAMPDENTEDITSRKQKNPGQLDTGVLQGIRCESLKKRTVSVTHRCGCRYRWSGTLAGQTSKDRLSVAPLEVPRTQAASGPARWVDLGDSRGNHREPAPFHSVNATFPVGG